MRKKAFTLVEMTIAITVFTIFIGFSMSTYISFHRAQQEAGITRSLMLETEYIMNYVSEALKENRIDYEYYDEGGVLDPLAKSRSKMALELLGGSSGAIEKNVLALRSPDGETQIIFDWDEDSGYFTVQEFDASGDELDGYLEPILLNSEETKVAHMGFTIFPSKDPYSLENIENDDLQYQPIVGIDMIFSRPGRVREEVVLDLHTSVTSRFYR